MSVWRLLVSALLEIFKKAEFVGVVMRLPQLVWLRKDYFYRQELFRINSTHVLGVK
jgi:hypothetical protein